MFDAARRTWPEIDDPVIVRTKTDVLEIVGPAASIMPGASRFFPCEVIQLVLVDGWMIGYGWRSNTLAWRPLS